MHENLIAHRDIKPANILITKLYNGFKLYKLGDFGISSDFNKDYTQTASGLMSNIFAAPE